MVITLVGGGPDSVRSRSVAEPFIAACRDRGAERIAVVLAGDRRTAEHFYPEYRALLEAVGDVLDVVPLADGVVPERLAGYDAYVVGGGPTPVYCDALAGVAALIREHVQAGAPYLGFSAGAMIAPDSAIVGGHLSAGASVCPVEWSEGLDEIELRPGLGLVPWAVDTHAAQAGTLGRAIEVVARGLAAASVAIDEDTALVLDDDGDTAGVVVGSGRGWWVSPDGGPLRSGRFGTVVRAQTGVG